MAIRNATSCPTRGGGYSGRPALRSDPGSPATVHHAALLDTSTSIGSRRQLVTREPTNCKHAVAAGAMGASGPLRNPADHRSRADHASPLLRRDALGGGAAGAATIVAVVGAEMPTVAVAGAGSDRPSGSALPARSSAAESPTHGAGMRATTVTAAARAANGKDRGDGLDDSGLPSRDLRVVAAAVSLCQFSSILRAEMNASCGISTLPNSRIFFLPAFCLSSNFRLREMSPP